MAGQMAACQHTWSPTHGLGFGSLPALAQARPGMMQHLPS